ncbi:MAG: GTP-binding protein, partial [Cyanobacteria bacterium P01_D01_bin.56]
LDEVLIELTGGAYGQVMRLKGIFELPDGQAFYVDFVEGLPGIEYTELKLPRWLQGRPDRFSGLEIVGRNLEQKTIAQTLLTCCLADDVLTQYQRQYQQLQAEEEAIAVANEQKEVMA